MRRSYSVLLITALSGSGWFVIDGPGLEKLTQLLKQLPAGSVQALQQSPAGAVQAPPGYSASVPGSLALQPNAQIPAVPAGGQYPANTRIPVIPVGQVAQLPPQLAAPTIRIASFNIQVFGESKGSQQHVMWTLATIIRNFHVVAIQEIRTKDDYFLANFLRDYVNQQGRYYDYVIGPRLGRSNSKEQYAFLFDTAVIEVNRNNLYTVNDPDDLLHREPLVAMFRTRAPPQEAFTFVLVNIHTDPDETATELDALGQVYQVVRQVAGAEDDVLVLGDLNVDDQHLGKLGQIPGVRPIVRGVPTNTRQTSQYDNIVLQQQSTSEFTGRWGVYDVQRMHNLTLDQALQVSDHLPIWAEFSAFESAIPGRFATGNAPAQMQ